MQGSLLDKRYKIIKPLGRGFFGATYLAQDMRRMGRQCVVKHLQPASKDPYTLQAAKKLFESEARTLEKLGQHDQIPDLQDYFQEDNEFYLVQELIDGNPLNTEIKPDGKLTETEIIEILKDVLAVLSYVHQCQVIHRDIKPNNLMRRYKDRKIVLIDFGAVKQVRTQQVNAQGLTNFTQVIGTPGYMPDEQLRGTPHFNSDIYALGITAIQGLTGVAPTELQSDPRTGEAIWHELVKINPQLQKILDKMVRRSYTERYQSVDEVISDLQKLTSFSIRPHAFKLPITLTVLLLLGMGGLIAYICPKLENFFQQGLEKVEKQDWSGAIAAFTKALENNPRNGQAYLYRGNAYLQLKQPQKAIEDYNRALDFLEREIAGIGVEWQSDPEKGLIIISVLENSPASQVEIKAGDRVLAIDGQSTKNMNVQKATEIIRSSKAGTPVTLRIQRQDSEFTLVLKRISIVNREYAQAYNYRGKARYQLGDIKAAIADYSQAIQVDPNYSLAYYNRAEVSYYDLGDKQAALADYSQAIRLNPQNAAAFLTRGNIRYDLNEKQAAVEDYTQVININPNYSLAYYHRAKAYLYLGKKQAAIADFNQAIRVNSNWGAISLADAYFQRAFAYEDIGNKQAALADYNQAIQLNPNYTEAYNNRGNLRSELGNKQGAIEDYNQAIRISPTYYLAYYNRGLVYQDLGNKQAAVEDYTQTIYLNRYYESAYYNRGIAYQDLGNKQAAVEDYTSAISINPNKANAYYNRGLVRSQLGDKQGAIADYEKAAQLYKQQGEIRYYQDSLNRITSLRR
jgi:serine/threonine protein kinase/predicted TPR repeat methyltransferase